jgi:hypothetical protein
MANRFSKGVSLARETQFSSNRLVQKTQAGQKAHPKKALVNFLRTLSRSQS